MSGAFWLGFATFPTVIFVAFWLYVAWVQFFAFLERHGFFVEVLLSHRDERVSDYLLRHDVFWERSAGPVFAGGWYRENKGWAEDHWEIVERLATRWIGVGSPNGPSISILRKREVGREGGGDA